MTLSPTDIGGNDLLARLGVTGSFGGITAAKDGTTATKLNVTVAATGWVFLPNGDFFDTTPAGSPGLATVSITGLSSNNTYTLWADANAARNAIVFKVATTAPSVTAVAIATVVVAGSVITAVTALPSGLNGLPGALTPRILQATVKYTAATTAIGTLPAGAVIDAIDIAVTTAFDAGTTNTVSVGKSGAVAAFLAATDVSSLGLSTPAGTVVGGIGASAIPVTATYAQTGGAATAGVAVVTVRYHLP